MPEVCRHPLLLSHNIACLQVMDKPECALGRNAVAYKLRAPDAAVLDMYGAFDLYRQHHMATR